MFSRLSLTLAALFVLVAAPAACRAEATDLVLGKTQIVEGYTGITFWLTKRHFMSEDAGEYQMLQPGAESILLEGATIAAPPGVVVEQVSLSVAPEETSYSYRIGRTETTVRYKQYRIQGQWRITVPPGTPEGEMNVRIKLPAVAIARDALKAVEPSGETCIYLPIKVFASDDARAGARWATHLGYGSGWLVGLTIGLAGVGFGLFALCYAGSFHGILLAGMFGFLAFGAGKGFVEHMSAALVDLWVLSPAKAVGIAIAVNVGYMLLFWLVSGFGRWNRVWSQCLGMGLFLLTLAVGLSFVVLPGFKWVTPNEMLLASLMMLPGLGLTFLFSLRRVVVVVVEQEPTLVPT